MWLLNLFMEKPASAALSPKTCLTIPGARDKKGSQLLTVSHRLPLNMLTVHVVDKTDAEAVNFKQLLFLNAVEYLQALWTNAIRCGTVYENDPLKDKFVEGLS